jgi:hypothetical protein
VFVEKAVPALVVLEEQFRRTGNIHAAVIYPVILRVK